MAHFEIELDKIPQSVKHDMQSIIAWLNTNASQELQLQATGMLFRPSASPDFISLKDRVIKVLDALSYDFTNYSIDDYIEHIANFLQTTVKVVPFDLSISTSGVCVRFDGENFIFFNNKRHVILQEHIIIHETAHLLMNHSMLKINADSLSNIHENQVDVHFRTYESIYEAISRHFLKINELQEAEAEEFARQFLAKANVYNRYIDLSKTRNTRLYPPFK